MSGDAGLLRDIATFFDRRSVTYDDGDFHPRLVAELIAAARLDAGQSVLDVATGTGLVAVQAATEVGPAGTVTGIDISPGMLAQARAKIGRLGLGNVRLMQCDAALADFPEASFDRVLCSAGLVFMADAEHILRLWRRCLKPGGLALFDAPAENSTAAGSALAYAARRNGVKLAYARQYAAGASRDLLGRTGFEIVQVSSVTITRRIMPPGEVEPAFETALKHPLSKPLRDLTPEQLARVRADYLSEIGRQVTGEGLPDENVMQIVVGRKPLCPEG